MTCRFVSTDRPRALRGRHGDECPEVTWQPPLVWTDCDGCEPCPKRHCGTCGHRHVEALTCPECVGEAREDLGLIADMCRSEGASAVHLLTEAAHRGVASEAMMLDAPPAEPEAWRQRRRYGYRDGADDVVGENHPLWVLGTWDLLVTEHYGHHRSKRVTIGSAAAYLKANLTDLAQDADFAFGDLAADLRGCRGHLEDVLRCGEQVEKGAPCLTCKTPLTRTTDEAGRVAYGCTRCHKTLTQSQYDYAVRVAHKAHADRLNAVDLAERLGVSASSIRRWANVLRTQRKGEPVAEHLPLIRSCGRDTQGRKLYRVADAQAVQDAGGDRRRSGTVSIEGVA